MSYLRTHRSKLSRGLWGLVLAASLAITGCDGMDEDSEGSEGPEDDGGEETLVYLDDGADHEESEGQGLVAEEAGGEFDEVVARGDRGDEGFEMQPLELEPEQEAELRTRVLAQMVTTYRQQHGELPEGLEALTDGDQPFLHEIPRDPWGNEYIYRVTTDEEFEVLSAGSDGELGTERDVRTESAGATEMLRVE